MPTQNNLFFKLRVCNLVGLILSLILFVGCAQRIATSGNKNILTSEVHATGLTIIKSNSTDSSDKQSPPKLNISAFQGNPKTGSELEFILRELTLDEREKAIFEFVSSGNIPPFLNNLTEMVVNKEVDGVAYSLRYFVTPDYFSIGTDADHFLIPITPHLAQRICKTLDCMLPTKRMVDQIWNAAPFKLEPNPIPPSSQMTDISVMYDHHQIVQQQRLEYLYKHPIETLTVGHKKDVIISNRIYAHEPSKRVVIYGWHEATGKPIQPVYSGHTWDYVDYSHGLRLIHLTAWLNGEKIELPEILLHPKLHVLISDEGIIKRPSYLMTD